MGFDAYQKLIASDVTWCSSPPPRTSIRAFLTAAVAAGKHVFCEKPHGLDVPGLKVAMAAARDGQAEEPVRWCPACAGGYDKAVQETVKRVKDGAIGDIIAIQEYYLSSPYGLRERKPEWSEMEYQYQNWYHFNWLSGDQTAQQLIHSIDKSSWAHGRQAALQAWGTGGRQACVQPKYGDQFDHHAVVFDYAKAACRSSASAAISSACSTKPPTPCWAPRAGPCCPSSAASKTAKAGRCGSTKAPRPTCTTTSTRRSSTPSAASSPSTTAATCSPAACWRILAQMVCYTGQRITWEQAMQSTEVLGPGRYAFDAEPSVKPDAAGNYPAPIPGITRYKLPPAKSRA